MGSQSETRAMKFKGASFAGGRNSQKPVVRSSNGSGGEHSVHEQYSTSQFTLRGKCAQVAKFAFMDLTRPSQRGSKQVTANKEAWATLRSLQVSSGIGADLFSHAASPDMEHATSSAKVSKTSTSGPLHSGGADELPKQQQFSHLGVLKHMVQVSFPKIIESSKKRKLNKILRSEKPATVRVGSARVETWDPTLLKQLTVGVHYELSTKADAKPITSVRGLKGVDIYPLMGQSALRTI